MRVTQNMLDRNMLFAMQLNLERLQEVNEQLSTGHRINTFSDDVPGSRQVLELARENEQINTYLDNLGAVDSMLSFATSSLENCSETITRVKELAIQAATGTYTDANRQIMAEGVDNLLSTLVGLANVKSQGTYVFGGQDTHTAPYEVVKDANGDIVSVAYQGARTTTEIQVGPGTMSDSNLVGKELFQQDGDLFATVISLRDAMRAGDQDEINRLIGEMETSHSDVRQALGNLGERQSQLGVLQNACQRFVDLNTQVLSDQQDADVAELAIQYNSVTALLQIVMKVTAQNIKPTLANFF